MKPTWTIFEGDKFWWDGSWGLSLERVRAVLSRVLFPFTILPHGSFTLWHISVSHVITIHHLESVITNEWWLQRPNPLRYPAATRLRQKESFLCAHNTRYADKHKYRKSFNCAVPGTDFISETTSLILIAAEKFCDTAVYPESCDNQTFIHGCQL